MKIDYKLILYGHWAIGSGKGGGSGKDSIIIKDKYKLPFIPGRTFKGLLRDAATECSFPIDQIVEVFGHENHGDKEAEASLKVNVAGNARFSSVKLPEPVRNELKNNEALISNFYQTRTSTRLTADKQAEDHSLRKMEVCIPVVLIGSITELKDESQKQLIVKSLKMLKFLGEKRYRGLGRCKIECNT